MSNPDTIYIKELEVECIIGIFRWERTHKQKVLISLELPCDARKAAASDRVEDTVDYKRISKRVLAFVSASRFKLIESLAEAVTQLLLKEFKLGWAGVSVSKPGAIRFSKDVGVRITRSLPAAARLADADRAYLSIGSNIDKDRMMKAAFNALSDAFGNARLSSVYESAAVGPAQPPFWNAVAEIRTDLSPSALNAALKKIETRLGRKRTADKYAPRLVDLDVVFYGSRIEPSFKLPHPDSAKAPYILLPMAELNPNFVHPTLKKTIAELIGSQLVSKGNFRRVMQ